MPPGPHPQLPPIRIRPFKHTVSVLLCVPRP
ncbi:hypothetical protein EMIT0P4_40292 [Pseudomonas sp. IT-P4]